MLCSQKLQRSYLTVAIDKGQQSTIENNSESSGGHSPFEILISSWIYSTYSYQRSDQREIFKLEKLVSACSVLLNLVLNAARCVLERLHKFDFIHHNLLLEFGLLTNIKFIFPSYSLMQIEDWSHSSPPWDNPPSCTIIFGSDPLFRVSIEMNKRTKYIWVRVGLLPSIALSLQLPVKLETLAASTPEHSSLHLPCLEIQVSSVTTADSFSVMWLGLAPSRRWPPATKKKDL